MAALINKPPSAGAHELDSEMAALRTRERSDGSHPGWLRGEFEVSQGHVAAIVAGLLLKTAGLDPCNSPTVASRPTVLSNRQNGLRAPALERDERAMQRSRCSQMTASRRNRVLVRDCDG